MHQLFSLFVRLGPSKQRLVRELIWNLAQLERLTVPEDHDARLDYSAHVGQWLESLIARGYSKETIRRHRRQVIRFLEVSPHPTQASIESFLADLITRGRDPSTVASALESFRSFLGFLFDRSFTTFNPAAKIPRPRRPRKYRKPASADLVSALLSAPMQLRHKVMMFLFADCGLRVRELAAAEISNVNFEAKLISVFGKGSKERQVPMSNPTAEILQRHLSELRSLGYTEDWLFPGKVPGTHLSTDSIRDYTYRVSAKLGSRISPHQLRHYFATSILSQGASVKAVSLMLGHADTSTTVDTYWHIFNEKEITDQHSKFNPLKGVSPAETLGE